MKFILILLSLSYSLSTFSLSNSITEECSEHAKNNYLVKGSWESEQGGDRLWDFPKLTKTFKSSNSARCDKEAFNQALSDSNEYWEHIASKYECPDSGAQQCQSSETNLNYIELCKATYSNELSNVHEDVLICETGDQSVEEVEEFAEENVEILSNMLPEADFCDAVPKKYRKLPNQVEKSSRGAGLVSCMVGVVKGAFNSIKDLFTSLWDLLNFGKKIVFKNYEMMARFLKAAYYGTIPQFIAEAKEEGEQFFKDVAAALMSIPNQIISSASKGITEWGCMNDLGRTEYACRTVAHLGADVLLSTLTFGANKAKYLKIVLKPVSKVLAPAAKYVKPVVKPIANGIDRMNAAASRVKVSIKNKVTSGKPAPSVTTPVKPATPSAAPAPAPKVTQTPKANNKQNPGKNQNNGRRKKVKKTPANTANAPKNTNAPNTAATPKPAPAPAVDPVKPTIGTTVSNKASEAAKVVKEAAVKQAIAVKDGAVRKAKAVKNFSVNTTKKTGKAALFLNSPEDAPKPAEEVGPVESEEPIEEEVPMEEEVPVEE